MHWWTGAYPSTVNVRELDNRWQEGNRAGFFDVSGRLSVEFNDGSCLLMASGDVQNTPIQVSTKTQLYYELDEISGTLKGSNILELNCKTEFQSDLTGMVFDSIVEDGSCGLPSLKDSVECSELVTESLTEHWQKNMGGKALSALPIT